MIRFLSSSLLALGLVAAGPALAQESQAVEFDFDQQSAQSPAASPSDASREPITAPVRPAAQSAETKSSSAPLPPGASKPTPAKDKDGVIVVTGEPDPAAAQQPPLSEDDLFDLFAAPEPQEVTLTPEGLPPTTSVPAGPGEARVEKTKPDESAPPKSQSASKPSGVREPNVPSAKKKEVRALTAESSGKAVVKKAKKSVAASQSSSAVEAPQATRDDLPYRRWLLARKAWSRVGIVGQVKSGSLVPDRLLLPITKAGLPQATPVPSGQVYADAKSLWLVTAAETVRVP